MALLPKEQAAIDAARKRGMSQGKIDKFLKENEGDYDRLRTQMTDAEYAAEEASRRGKSTGATPAATTTPTAASTPMAALQASAPTSTVASEPTTPAEAPDSAAGAMAALPPMPPPDAGMGLQGGAIGALRPLGQRSYPQTSMALTGLKRIY